MIFQDTISLALTIASLFFCMWLSTFSTTANILFPSLILIGGLIIQIADNGGSLPKDGVFKIGFSILLWGVSAFVGLMMGGYAVKKFLVPSSLIVGLSTQETLMYGMIMAIGETQLFQGAWLNYLLKRLDSFTAILLASLTFTVFHFAIYGVDIQALGYVFLAGFVLNYVTYFTKRLSPACIGHLLNNIVALM